MNEILGVLIYVLGTSEDAEFAEADSFFCFSIVMAEVRDLFIRDLDSEATGVQGNIAKLEKLLFEQDPQVAAHLQRLQIHTQYYAFRWLTTLLTREFDLPESIRLWDSLLASVNRLAFLHRACCALVTSQRDLLLASDFPTCLKALQRTSPVPIDVLLRETDVVFRTEVRRAAYPPSMRSSPSLAEFNVAELFNAGLNAAQRALEAAVVASQGRGGG